MAKKVTKTNAVRLIEQQKIPYELVSYQVRGTIRRWGFCIENRVLVRVRV